MNEHQGHSIGPGEGDKYTRKSKTMQPVVILETWQMVKVKSRINNLKSQRSNRKAESMRITQMGSNTQARNGSQTEVSSHRAQRAIAETTELFCF